MHSQFQYIMSILNQMDYEADQQESLSCTLSHLQEGKNRQQPLSQLHALNQQVRTSFFIQNEIMKKIQLLEYCSETIQEQFKRTVEGNIEFHDYLPTSISTIGDKLIQDGLFHQLWKKAAHKHDPSCFQNYYQRFAQAITIHYTHFQNAFNLYDSDEQVELIANKEIDQDSNTRLTQNKTIINCKQKLAQNSVLHSSKENQQIQYSFCQPSERIRLAGEMQTNKRRLNAEMVCYFLGLKKVYRLSEMQIDKILQFYHNEGKQVLIIQAHEPTYYQAVSKVAIDYRPKTYMAMYGFVSFAMLLRIKQQYTPIEGFIVYEELFNLPLWMKKNGFIESAQV